MYGPPVTAGGHAGPSDLGTTAVRMRNAPESSGICTLGPHLVAPPRKEETVRRSGLADHSDSS